MCLADDCLSTDKTAVQVSDDTEADRPAGLAVDFGNQSTYSCTDSLQGLPWWAVDLGEASAISHVILTLPSVSGDDRNYCLHSLIHQFTEETMNSLFRIYTLDLVYAETHNQIKLFSN